MIDTAERAVDLLSKRDLVSDTMELPNESAMQVHDSDSGHVSSSSNHDPRLRFNLGEQKTGPHASTRFGVGTRSSFTQPLFGITD